MPTTFPPQKPIDQVAPYEAGAAGNRYCLTHSSSKHNKTIAKNAPGLLNRGPTLSLSLIYNRRPICGCNRGNWAMPAPTFSNRRREFLHLKVIW